MKDSRQTLLALAEKTVAYGMKHSDQIEVLVKNNFEISAEIILGEISRTSKSQEAGASIRCVVGKRLGSAFTNRLEQNILEKVNEKELNKMITFLQFQLEKTEERLNETIKVKRGLEEVIKFLEKRKKINGESK